MTTSRKVFFRAIPLLRSLFERHYGWRWPLALARCALRWRMLVAQTRWAGRDDDESRYARALTLVPSVYLVLRERLGARALDVVRGLATAMLKAASARTCAEESWPDESDPRARWHTFFDHAVARGLGAFDEIECLSVETEKLHFRVRRCLFADLARDIGLPELARMTCDLMVPFCRELLPGYRFRRGGSPESTLAYGHPCCDYIWEPMGVSTTDGATAASAGERPVPAPLVAERCEA
jgi:hypothetical protein